MTSAATALPNPAALQGQTLLPHWGLIRAQGADAARFLHGQLTQDFSLLGLHEARLAAFCSAKGRMLASFVGFKRAHDDVLLACHRDLLPATLKRLSLFVLRAQVRLSDASDAFQLRGIASLEGLGAPWTQTLVTDAADASRQETAQHTAQETPQQAPQEAPQQSSQPVAHQIALYPAAGLQRALWVAPAGTAPPARGPLEPAHWAWLEVMSGIAMITQPVVDAFVPQMLNYESVGGVNFKKGCYPGQEVVARSQFRGTLKRRTHLVASDAPLAVGQPVFHTDDAEQPCGTVAAAAAHPAGGWNALVCLQTSAANGGALTVDHAQGAALTLLPLPYPLLDDI